MMIRTVEIGDRMLDSSEKLTDPVAADAQISLGKRIKRWLVDLLGEKLFPAASEQDKRLGVQLQLDA